MQKPISLEAFYQQKIHWLPGNLQQDLGHFNVFRIEEFVGPTATRLPYSRKDFFKISLVTGRSNYHYADKTVQVDGNALFFANPLVPYKWEVLDGEVTGYFCIFTEAFLKHPLLAGLAERPVFKPGGQPLYTLTDTQHAVAKQLFEQLFVELDSSYAHKYELLRSHVFTLVHIALKLQPATVLYQEGPASARITALFTELLERQFPLENPHQPVRLRTAQAFAGQLAVHVNHLNRALKEVTGKTTTQLIAERLLREAHTLLKHTNWQVAEISHVLGFEQPAHFSAFFKHRSGTTPSAVRAV
jgi:AraC family transcriptional activator of pobA